MKFVDSVKIEVQSGNGGSGCTSFRREKYVALGGPNGGDGGDGGHVYFVGDSSKNTLLDLSYTQHQYASNGGPGAGKGQHGKTGKDRFISVPLGTLVKEEGESDVLLEVVEEKPYLFMKGGKGGKGNARFKTSKNRAPEYHQPGLPGESMWARLELKLMADVGLVGFPNAGKSTFISSVSHARPKIADYPFTTLRPQLGVVQLPSFETFVVADIPGIIEGAHAGKGLGDRFLKHIERTSILAILLDMSQISELEPVDEYHALLKELSLFSEELLEKPRVVVLGKMDAVSELDEVEQVQQDLKSLGETVFQISSVSRQGLDKFLRYLGNVVHSSPDEYTIHNIDNS